MENVQTFEYANVDGSRSLWEDVDRYITSQSCWVNCADCGLRLIDEFWNYTEPSPTGKDYLVTITLCDEDEIDWYKVRVFFGGTTKKMVLTMMSSIYGIALRADKVHEIRQVVCHDLTGNDHFQFCAEVDEVLTPARTIY